MESKYHKALMELISQIDEIEEEVEKHSYSFAQVDIEREEGIFLELQKDKPWHCSYWNRTVEPPVFFDDIDDVGDVAVAKLSIFLDKFGVD